MGKTILISLVILVLSAIIICAQGQTDQSEAFVTEASPSLLPSPHEYWWVFEPYIGQYAEALRLYYGFDHCYYYNALDYVLFIFGNNTNSELRVALFDVKNVSFVDDLGTSRKLYFNYYLHQHKSEIVSTMRSNLRHQEGDVDIISSFTNSACVENGWVVGAVTEYAREVVNCLDPKDLLGCATGAMSAAVEAELSSREGELTYDQVLEDVGYRQEILPNRIDEYEKLLETAKTEKEIADLISYYPDFKDIKKILDEEKALANIAKAGNAHFSEGLLKAAQDDLYEECSRQLDNGWALAKGAKLLYNVVIQPNDYRMATRFGALANWHAQVASLLTQRAENNLAKFEANPSIENYHQVVRDCINSYDNLAVGYLLISKIIESQKESTAGKWFSQPLSDAINNLGHIVEPLGINLGPNHSVDDLIRNYETLSRHDLSTRKTLQIDYDQIAVNKLFGEITDVVVPEGQLTNEDLHLPELGDANFYPDSGSECGQFTFSIVYKDEDGDEAQDAYVIIKGFDGTNEIYNTQKDINKGKMIRGPGKPSSGIQYTYTTTLKAAPECYYRFYFSNKNGNKVYLPEDSLNSPGLRGPQVESSPCSENEVTFPDSNLEAAISILIDDSHSHTYRQINQMNVEELNFSSQTLSEFPLNNLSNFDIILIDQPTRYYSNSEIEKIKEFVRNGGGLLVTNDWAYDSGKVTNAVNTVTKIFGISTVEANAGGGPYTKGNGTLRNHEISKGVDSVHAGAVSRLEIPHSADILIQSNSSTIGAAMSYGSGRIVVLGDNDLIDRDYGYDNVKFFKNILLWLSQKAVSSDAISSNLVVNPGAETSDTKGWQHTKEFYATGFQSQASGTVYPHQGNNFFSMAPFEGTYGKAIQNISISEYASNVDNGIAEINAGTWIQNEYLGDNPDSCKMNIQYLDSR